MREFLTLPTAERFHKQEPGWQSFFFQAEDGIRDRNVTGVQTCALPISMSSAAAATAIALLAFIPVLSHARRDVTAAEAAELIVAGIESPSRAPDDVWLESGLPRLLTSSLIRERVPGVVDPSGVRAAGRSAGLRRFQRQYRCRRGDRRPAASSRGHTRQRGDHARF